MSDFYLQIEKSKVILCSFFEGIDIYILVKRKNISLTSFSLENFIL